MASNTPNINLHKKDPVVDGNDTFNIKTMLNDNWDKIDSAIGNINTSIDDIEYPVTSVNNKTGEITLNADDVGAETPSAAQNKANTAENNAKTHANGLIGTLSSLLTSVKTNLVAAINELFNDLSSHKADNTKHITSTERSAWNAKETPSGAQTKAEAAANVVQQDLNNHKVERATLVNSGHVKAKTDENGVIIIPVDERTVFLNAEGDLTLFPNGNFYDSGDEFLKYTSGWVGTTKVGGIAQKNANHLYLKSGTDPTGYANRESKFKTNRAIDLTPYKEIRIDWEAISENQVSNYSRLSCGSTYVEVIGSFTRKTSVLNVSSLEGDFVLDIVAHNSTNAPYRIETKIYKIWGVLK